jgi:hypothetical protein
LSELEQESGDLGGDVSPGARNIYQRIQAIKREVHGVDQKGKHTHGFRFAKHDDVTHALSGLYVKHGVDREVSIEQVERVGPVLAMWVTVTWVNVDDPADFKKVKVFAEGVDVGKRGQDINIDGLASGKGLSYAVKIAEMKNFCLVGDTTLDNESPVALAPAEAPTDVEFAQLCEGYKSAATIDQFQAARVKVSIVLARLSSTQQQELSKLDHQAKERIK